MAAQDLKLALELLMLPGETLRDIRDQWTLLSDADRAELLANARNLRQGDKDSPQVAA